MNESGYYKRVHTVSINDYDISQAKTYKIGSKYSKELYSSNPQEDEALEHLVPHAVPISTFQGSKAEGLGELIIRFKSGIYKGTGYLLNLSSYPQSTPFDYLALITSAHLFYHPHNPQEEAIGGYFLLNRLPSFGYGSFGGDHTGRVLDKLQIESWVLHPGFMNGKHYLESGCDLALVILKNIKLMSALRSVDDPCIANIGKGGMESIGSKVCVMGYSGELPQVIHSYITKSTPLQAHLLEYGSTPLPSGYDGAPIFKSDNLIGIHMGFNHKTQTNCGVHLTTSNRQFIAETLAMETCTRIGMIHSNSLNNIHYFGELKYSEWHGKGILWNKEKFIYQGNFVNGIMHGKGTFEFEDDGSTYTGEIKENQMHGKGKFKWANGEIYEGNFKHGKMTGRVICCNNIGILYQKIGRYEGDFINLRQEGKGIYYYKNGDCYQGDFFDGLSHGTGIFYFAKGGRYEGEFKNGNIDGRGVRTYKDGRQEIGIFKNGKAIRCCCSIF